MRSLAEWRVIKRDKDAEDLSPSTNYITSRSIRLLLWQPDVVDNHAGEHRQADGWDHPGAAKVVVHLAGIEANDGHKREAKTKGTGDCETGDGTCAALRLSERQSADEGVEDQSDTTLVLVSKCSRLL